MRSLYIRGNLLSRNFGFCSDTVKVQLFKTFCSNMYCSHLWSSFKKCTLNKLRVAYNNCLRRLMSIPKFCSASQMFVYLDVRSFGEFVEKWFLTLLIDLKRVTMVLLNLYIPCVLTPIYKNIGGVFYIQISNFLCCIIIYLLYLLVNIYNAILYLCAWFCFYTSYTHLFNDL